MVLIPVNRTSRAIVYIGDSFTLIFFQRSKTIMSAFESYLSCDVIVDLHIEITCPLKDYNGLHRLYFTVLTFKRCRQRADSRQDLRYDILEDVCV